jgi:imidazolonepropionase-like amidohydrolase
MRAAGITTVKSYNQPRRDQRQQIIEAARQLGMMVVPEGGSLFQHNMTMVIDGHTTIEHAIPLARLYDDVHQLWRQTGTAYNPTLSVAYGGSYGENYWYQESEVWNHPILTQYVPRRLLDARARRPVTLPDNEWNHVSVAREARRLSDQGVVVAIGAHGQREGLAAHWEMWMLSQGGMAPLEAIRAGTLNGAKALGMDRDIGSLEVGKLADMVVLDGNPLENIRNTSTMAFTVLNGRVYDAGMNEIAPRRRPRAPFWFVAADGEALPSDTAAETETDGDHGH